MKNNLMRTLPCLAMLVAATFFAACGSANSSDPIEAVSEQVDDVVEQVEASAPEQESLYDRLGGICSIAVVTGDVMERVLINETIEANPA